MKASLKLMNKDFILALAPETSEERMFLEGFGRTLSRGHLINCRGFKYLSEEVEFLIQNQPRGD